MIVNKNRVAINATNLHAGGGVQVATSFITELSKINIPDLDISVFVSSEVKENLDSIFTSVKSFSKFMVVDSFGLNIFPSRLQKEFNKFDLVFTVFGPDYFVFNKYLSLVGFAQPWILYPHNPVYEKISLIGRVKSKIKFFLQELFFRRADYLIVELEHVKEILVSRNIAKIGSIGVVHNCISSLYLDSKYQLKNSVTSSGAGFKIGFVSRDYPHKNTSILPLVKSILSKKYCINVSFYVTLNEVEWVNKSDDFRSSVINVGALTVAQCPDFYSSLDAVIFPSLLECFSATPLEAMVMGKPLFASDRSFVRDICKEFAFYFDPLDAESIAATIANYINGFADQDFTRLCAARDYALGFSNAQSRAIQYLATIRNMLN